MKRMVTAAVAALLVLASGFVATPVSQPALAAQQTINSTTLAAAATATTSTFSVASASTIATGQVAYVDREMVLITGISSTTLTVTRGYNGTLAVAHDSGALIYTGPPNYFYQNDVAGPCVATNEVATPHINAALGNIFVCSDSEWVRYENSGYGQYSVGAATTYTALGAITVKPGLSLINGTTLAMTLASPTTQQDGMIMAIFAANASAHTITTTAGFNGGTTSRDVCTLGGAVGDGIVIQAWGGVWYVLANRNCTLG